MATSGTYTYALTAREIVTVALEELGVVDSYETASAADAASALRRLNLMLKTWQAAGPDMFRMTEGAQTLTSAVASYALTSLNPYRLASVRYRATSGRDLPMTEMTRDEYYDLPDKTTSGIPTQYYFDPQRDSGTIYVWPVLASATTESLRLTYQRRFEDVTSLDQHVDITQEGLETVAINLAERLGPMFSVAADRMVGIRTNAALLRRTWSDSQREAVVRFEPAGRR